MLASPARRAKQTAELVAEACGYADAIRWEHVFYSGDADDLLAVLQDLPREIERPLLVGHNPTLEETVALLLGEPWLGVRLPTAGLVRLDVKLDGWRDLEAGDGVLRWLVIPKLLRQLERGRISEGGDG
jgi:phosphohistidine phosphatase